jgi:hypothetical protein
MQPETPAVRRTCAAWNLQLRSPEASDGNDIMAESPDDHETIRRCAEERKFDAEGLDFIYQDRTASGDVCSFNKLVNR